MFFSRIFKKRKRTRGVEIAPDEIFLDAKNLPEHNRDQFEGRLEKRITRRTPRMVGLVFSLIVVAFSLRLVQLEIVQGETYKELARENRLERKTIFSNRGIVYDRNGKELIWNKNKEKKPYSERVYIDKKGLSHILGYVSYPEADEKGVYYRKTYIGRSGAEKVFGGRLSGENGSRIVEYSATGEVVSKNKVLAPVSGENITLSIDAKLQNKLYLLMEELSEKIGFRGGSAVIMNVHTGGLLAAVSFPQFDSSIMTEGEKEKIIASYSTSSSSPFLFRATSGLYAPGSIVKPFMALGGLNEGVITEETVIVAPRNIRIPNRYFPDKYTLFWDWKAHGPLTVRGAIAESSNIFFYQVGGGYKSQPGIGIEKMNQYMHLFGFGEPTGFAFSEASGVIPNPEWKQVHFPQRPNWHLGDTYNTAIGQYGFTVTPLQVVRAVSAIANGGKLPTPSLLKNDPAEDIPYEIIDIPKRYFNIVQEGMRLAVTDAPSGGPNLVGDVDGTASSLDITGVKIAAKTGTAELGPAKEYTNSWVEGYFPYEDPKYAFAVVIERRPYDGSLGAVYYARLMLQWMKENAPEYLD